MASSGREIPGKHYGKDHPTHAEIESLGLRAVTEDGDEATREETRGRIFRVENPDDASGYAVGEMETPGRPNVLCYLRRA